MSKEITLLLRIAGTICFLLLLAFPVRASEPLEAIASRATATFSATEWNAAYPEWKQSHPAATCEEMRSTSFETDASEDWCYQCRVEANGLITHTWFYVFEDQAKPVCRLYQTRLEIPGVEDPEHLEGLVQAALAKQHGPGGPAEPNERGASFWRHVQGWRTSDQQIYSFIDRPPEQPSPMVTILARTRPLFSVLEAGTTRDEDKKVQSLWEEPMLSRLVVELGGEFPEAFSLVGQEEPPNQARLRSVIDRLLDAAERAPRARQPALLLAADRLAGSLHEFPPPAGASPSPIEYRGLHYAWAPLFDEGWTYQDDLVQRVWRDYRASPWADFAFLILLSAGFDTSHTCEPGSDQFRTVIPKATEFLDRRQGSPYRLDVRFALAQAYETWWSLSKAAPDAYVDPPLYAEGAEQARKSATDLYEEIASKAPESPLASYARRRLPRLKLRLDTQQRTFFCIYD